MVQVHSSGVVLVLRSSKQISLFDYMFQIIRADVVSGKFIVVKEAICRKIIPCLSRQRLLVQYFLYSLPIIPLTVDSRKSILLLYSRS